LIAKLRGGDPVPASPGLSALEERLERMETLLLRIAARLELS
jgi:hypothetical protein